MAIAAGRRRLTRVLAAALAAGPLLALATDVRAETALERPASLRDAGAAAAARHQPLVLLVSLPGCPYCERVRRSELLPLVRETPTPAVQIDIGSAARVEDFDGTVRSHDAVATRLQARFTPTVLFLGPDGTELAERLVGAGDPDFYGALLEQRLEAARSKLTER
jgi:thioredoxin-related protein